MDPELRDFAAQGKRVGNTIELTYGVEAAETAAISDAVDSLVLAYLERTPREKFVGRRARNIGLWAVFGVLLIIGFSGISGAAPPRLAAGATILAVVLLVISVRDLVRLKWLFRFHDQWRARRAEELHRAAMDAAVEAFTTRRAAAQRPPRPTPQPYGVSDRGAELLVADWMRHLGDLTANVTQYSGDGGIDVASELFIAQVKNYSGTVGVAPIRELAGVATVDGRKPLFFTSGTYTDGAEKFATSAGVALFRYQPETAVLTGSNRLALPAIREGLSSLLTNKPLV